MFRKVVIFDGVCHLCHSSVNMLIKLDKYGVLKYTSLQGEYVKSLDIAEGIDSIIFYDGVKIYYKSTAILHILYSLGGAWKAVNIFYIIPMFIRDSLYDLIAKYRYKIFGKMDSCRMPNSGEEVLFID